MILSEVPIQQRPTQNHEIYVNSAESGARLSPFFIHSFIPSQEHSYVYLFSMIRCIYLPKRLRSSLQGFGIEPHCGRPRSIVPGLLLLLQRILRRRCRARRRWPREQRSRVQIAICLCRGVAREHVRCGRKRPGYA